MHISSRRTEPAMQRIESEAVRELIRSEPIDAPYSQIPITKRDAKSNNGKHATEKGQVILQLTHQIPLPRGVLHVDLWSWAAIRRAAPEELPPSPPAPAYSNRLSTQ